MGWSGVDNLWIIVMFLSAVWTLILTAPIHCRASIAETVMQCYISPNLMKKQTHLTLHLGWMSTCWANFHFWVNHSLKSVFCTIKVNAEESKWAPKGQKICILELIHIFEHCNVVHQDLTLIIRNTWEPMVFRVIDVPYLNVNARF